MRSSPALVAIRLLQTVPGMLAVGLLWWTAGRRLDGWLGTAVDAAFWTYVVLRPIAVPLTWLTTTWEVDERGVRTTSGWLDRQRTDAGWDEIVSVDVSQPYLHRLFGCYAVRFGLGTTQRSALRLDAVSRACKDAVVAVARPTHPTEPPPSGEASPAVTTPVEDEVYRIRRRDYLLVCLAYGQFVLFVPAVLSALDELQDWVDLPLPDPGVVLGWPLALQVGAGAGLLLASVLYGWGFTWLRYRGFRVVRVGRTYVTSGGLLSSETRTISTAAVIGLKVTQNPLMRALGFGRVSVLTNDAGEQPMANLLFPVVRLATLPAALGHDLELGREVVTPTLRLPAPARAWLVTVGVLVAAALVAVAYAVRPGWLWASAPAVVLAVALVVNSRWVVAAPVPGRARCYARRGLFWLSHLELDDDAVHVVESSQALLGRLSRTWTVALHYYDGKVRCVRALGCDAERRAALTAPTLG